MTKTVQYYGTPNYTEEPLTGVKRLWTFGQRQDLPDATADMLVAAGNFAYRRGLQLFNAAGALLDEFGVAISGGGGSGSTRVVYTSKTCTSDADLSDGSASFGTDQTAKLQAILDLAIAGPLLVIWDGAYSVGAVDTLNSLRVRSNTIIRALPGCGCILRNASNVAMFSNYNRTVQGGSIVDKNIGIEGGIWNFNSSGQDHDTPANGFVYGMDFVGVDGFALTGGAQLRCGRTYHLHMGNWRNVRVRDIVVDAGSASPINTDGIHFNGPGSDLSINNVSVSNTGDDAVAINADDAYAAAYYGPYATYGDITDVDISDITLNTKLYGIRIFCGGSRIDRVSVSRVRGKAVSYALVIDNYLPAATILTGPGNMGSISIDDFDVDCAVHSSSGTLRCIMSIDCKIEQLNLSNVVRSKFNAVAFPTMRFGAKANIGQLSITNYRCYPFGGGAFFQDQIVLIAGANVDSMAVRSCNFGSNTAIAGYPITAAAGTTIGQMLLDNNLGTNFAGFFSSLGTVRRAHAISNNFMDSTSGLLTAGIALPGPTSATTVVADGSEATGGSGVYTYQWYRSTSSGTLGSAVSGQTTRKLSDTGLTGGTTYYYTLVYSDGATTANSNQCTVITVGAATFVTDANVLETSPTSVQASASPTGGVKTYQKIASDAFGGNVAVSARIIATSPTAPAINASLILRGSGISPWTTSALNCYYIDMSVNSTPANNGFVLSKRVAGVETKIGGASYIGTVSLTESYDIKLNANGSLITAQVQRLSDGFYAQPGGAWGAGVANIFSVTDTSIPAGAGLKVGGYMLLNAASQTLVVSNFATAAAT